MVDVYFEWRVSEAGYDWIETKPVIPDPNSLESKSFLTDDWGSKAPVTQRLYHPLTAHSGLCRTLADTTPDPAGIKQFADRFGPLLGGTGEAILLPQRLKNSLGHGEPLSVWHKAIFTLRQVIELWDMVKQSDLEGLRRHIVWRGNLVYYQSHPDFSPNKLPDEPFLISNAWIASDRYRAELFQNMVPDDVIRPAEAYIQKVINDNLTNATAPRLLWNSDQTSLSIHLQPKNLLGAIWLQLAQAIERNCSFRRCDQCQTWFEVSVQAGRSDKRYCSNACRINAHRGRKAQAGGTRISANVTAAPKQTTKGAKPSNKTRKPGRPRRA